MSVFRFQASPTSSKSNYRRTRGKSKESQWPTFAFSTSPSTLQDITLEKEIGLRNSASSGLTMKEYEEQLKKLTAENFNLKLRVYFVEERLSKVTGIGDKEDLIKKNIQLKITCESQLKELEKKQELLFEASKAFELLQKEHSEEIEKLMKEKEKEIAEWEEKFIKLEAIYNDIKSKFPILENLNDPDVEVKTFEEYEKQIADLCTNLRNVEDRNAELENMIKDVQLESESYELKAQRMESEMNQRMHRAEELVEELERKEHDLASANFKIRKLEDDLKSKQREVEIMKERIEEKNKTIESLKNSLASRYDTIESLENRIAKERSSAQSMQSKLDGLSFQNVKLKEELDILQSRLRRTTELMSPRGKGRAVEDEGFKQKYEELLRTMEEQESQSNKRIKELEEKLGVKNFEVEGYRELLEKHKKLEDDHRKACTALKNFIKRSSDEKKEREILNHMLSNHEEVIADLKTQLDRYRNNSIPKLMQDDKLSLAETGDNEENLERHVPEKEIRQRGTHSPVPDPLHIVTDKKRKNVSEINDGEEDADCTCKQQPDGATEKAKNHEVNRCRAVHSELELASENPVKGDLTLKKCDLEKLNGELKNRNIHLQQIVNRELSEKNCQIEKLENRLTEMNEVSSVEIKMLQREIDLRDHELNLLQNKLQELSGFSTDSPPHLECKLLLGVAKTESFCTSLGDSVNEMNMINAKLSDEDSQKKDVYHEKKAEFNKDDVICLTEKKWNNLLVRENIAEGAVRMCSLLSLRLEELAEFLDFLLKNGELSNSISLEKREDIKQTVENTRELSKRLSLSYAKKNFSDTAIDWDTSHRPGQTTQSSVDFITFSRDPKYAKSKDKVIWEQNVIISRLRDQVKTLNQEIKQRDVELTHCQGLDVKIIGCGGGDDDDLMNISDRDGIEKQTMSICQDLSDDIECKDQIACGDGVPIDTSESEAWSEPDRSVSLARMGKLNGWEPNMSLRNPKQNDSSESSEETTINENSKIPGKRRKCFELFEIRRLHSRIKALDEINVHLKSEINLLKSKMISSNESPQSSQDETIIMAEKLRHTLNRLDECNLTCYELEEKLASALRRASSSALQLSKAMETVTILESQICQLKKEITVKNTEIEEKNVRISSLENKIKEMAMESELKLAEANKLREAAERKTVEVECKLKHAENVSKEVESKVNEIEKKMGETKKLKKETASHVKEAEKHVDAAEKMMEEAEKVKADAERKSRDFQNFIDLMRKEVEDKLKEAERRIKKAEKEKEELEKQVLKLKKRLLEAEKNKTEVETKVKEGKETIRCMEEKLKELEIAMDHCNGEAQRKIKEIQKRAEIKVAELEEKMDEKERTRKAEVEKKMAEAEKISRELEIGFRKQLEEAEKKIRKTKEVAEAAIKEAQEEFKKQEAELKQKINDVEKEKKTECEELLRKLDEAKLEASEFELELMRLTNEKIHLEEEFKRLLDRESALVKDQEIKGKYEISIHKLEEKLTQLTLNKSQLASRLEEIESTNIDLVSRISAIRGKGPTIVEQEYSSTSPPTPRFFCPASIFESLGSCATSDTDGNKPFFRQGSTASDPGKRPLAIASSEVISSPRRHLNSSPDLGIESDPGRFSSLEANHPTTGNTEILVLGSSEQGEIKKLEMENAELRKRLTKTRQALEETLNQLSAANQRKKQVERAICKQLHKTHHILKKARVNFELQDGGDTLE